MENNTESYLKQIHLLLLLDLLGSEGQVQAKENQEIVHKVRRKFWGSILFNLRQEIKHWKKFERGPHLNGLWTCLC